MFDISLGELMVIGAVSLVVIGPEKLPKVARTVGMLIGRAQRFTANVKADLDREIAQGELAKLEAEMRSQGESIRSSISQPFTEAKAALLEAHPDHQIAALERAAPSPAVMAAPVMTALPLSPEEEERKHDAEANGLPYEPLAVTPPMSDLASLVASPAAHHAQIDPPQIPPADERQLDLFAPAAPPTASTPRDRR